MSVLSVAIQGVEIALPKLLSFGPTAIKLLESGATFFTGADASAIPTDIVNFMEKYAETKFPNLAPELKLVAGLVTSYHSNYTEWLQDALNKILGTNLQVDGVYGEQTAAAVQQLQTQFFMTVDGFAGDKVSALLQTILAKLGPKAAATAAKTGPTVSPETAPPVVPKMTGV